MATHGNHRSGNHSSDRDRRNISKKGSRNSTPQRPLDKHLPSSRVNSASLPNIPTPKRISRDIASGAKTAKAPRIPSTTPERVRRVSMEERIPKRLSDPNYKKISSSQSSTTPPDTHSVDKKTNSKPQSSLSVSNQAHVDKEQNSVRDDSTISTNENLEPQDTPNSHTEANREPAEDTIKESIGEPSKEWVEKTSNTDDGSKFSLKGLFFGKKKKNDDTSVDDSGNNEDASKLEDANGEVVHRTVDKQASTQQLPQQQSQSQNYSEAQDTTRRSQEATATTVSHEQASGDNYYRNTASDNVSKSSEDNSHSSEGVKVTSAIPSTPISVNERGEKKYIGGESRLIESSPLTDEQRKALSQNSTSTSLKKINSKKERNWGTKTFIFFNTLILASAVGVGSWYTMVMSEASVEKEASKAYNRGVMDTERENTIDSVMKISQEMVGGMTLAAAVESFPPNTTISDIIMEGWTVPRGSETYGKVDINACYLGDGMDSKKMVKANFISDSANSTEPHWMVDAVSITQKDCWNAGGSDEK